MLYYLLWSGLVLALHGTTLTTAQPVTTCTWLGTWGGSPWSGQAPPSAPPPGAGWSCGSGTSRPSLRSHCRAQCRCLSPPAGRSSRRSLVSSPQPWPLPLLWVAGRGEGSSTWPPAPHCTGCLRWSWTGGSPAWPGDTGIDSSRSGGGGGGGGGGVAVAV